MTRTNYAPLQPPPASWAVLSPVRRRKNPGPRTVRVSQRAPITQIYTRLHTCANDFYNDTDARYAKITFQSPITSLNVPQCLKMSHFLFSFEPPRIPIEPARFRRWESCLNKWSAGVKLSVHVFQHRIGDVRVLCAQECVRAEDRLLFFVHRSRDISSPRRSRRGL